MYNSLFDTIFYSICYFFLPFTDELRHLIGSETTRQGVMRVFNMFQYQHLNKRLAYVILEGVLETMFPDNKFDEVFRKIHTRSSRARKEQHTESETTIPVRRKKTVR